MPARAIWLKGNPAVSISHSVAGVRKRKLLADPQKVTSFERAEAIAAAINRLLQDGSYRWTGDGIEKLREEERASGKSRGPVP